MTSPDDPEDFIHIHIPVEEIGDVVLSLLDNLEGIDLAKRFGDKIRAQDIEGVDEILDNPEKAKLAVIGFEVILDALLSMAGLMIGMDEEHLRAIVFDEVTTKFTLLASEIADAKPTEE